MSSWRSSSIWGLNLSLSLGFGPRALLVILFVVDMLVGAARTEAVESVGYGGGKVERSMPMNHVGEKGKSEGRDRKENQ